MPGGLEELNARRRTVEADAAAIAAEDEAKAQAADDAGSAILTAGAHGMFVHELRRDDLEG